MQENIVLGLFLLLPLALGAVAVAFFRAARGAARTWPRLIAGNLLVFVLLGSLLLLAGELYYRFVYDTTDSFGLTRVTERWFQRHYHFNRAGYRDSVEYSPRIPEGRRRLTFLGDSFTAGHGVADVEARFANRLRAAHPDLDVLVIAENGWDTGAELEEIDYLDEEGYEWDEVVLVYVLNDISDIVPEWEAVLERIYDAPEPGFLIRNSYLLNTLYYRGWAARNPEVANYYDFVRDAYAGPLWDEQRERLRALRDAVEERGGRLRVVTFPFLHALGPDYPYRAIHQQLGRLWEELGVPHLDLLEVYGSLDPAELVVGPRDAHPNEEAHRLAAAAIDEFLAATS